MNSISISLFLTMATTIDAEDHQQPESVQNQDSKQPEPTRSHQHNNLVSNDEWIMLNVGGQIFTTTRTTLSTNEPNSMLARMFSFDYHENNNSRHNHSPIQDCNETNCPNSDEYCLNSQSIALRPSPRDSNGAYLIDRSPKYFEPILNYLRHGKLIIDHNINVQGVLEEAKFFGIVSLLPMLELETERWFRKRHQELLQSQINYNGDGLVNGGGADGAQIQTMPPLTRQDVIKALLSTSSSSSLRFQGCNLAGANLSKLDLRNINFKFANLRNSNLKGANLSEADLERADLYQSNLEGAQIIRTNLARANLECANLRAISTSIHKADFEFDPTNRQPTTTFEGANLRNSNFEGSRMVEVRMRAAILKGSNLQNCDLRAANFCNADLENCDLSGSTLTEAYFGGANLKGASFELEVL